MKNQNTTNSKLTKNTIFVFKNVKNSNGFSTDPTTSTMKTIFTSIDPTVFK